MPENFSFLRMPPLDNKPTIAFESKFRHADYITQAEVKDYAHKIADTINLFQSEDEQKKVLIDLLSEDTIKSMIASFRPDTDIKDVETMAMDTVKLIRKQIIEELKKYIPDTLYYFIEKQIDPGANKLNKKTIIFNKGKKSFLKETLLSSNEQAVALHASLKKLVAAFAKLKNPDEQMPFVRRPILVEESPTKISTDRPTISYTSEDKNLITLEDVFKNYQTDVEFSTRDALFAFTDCLRGAKFLADNELTLTDINTRNTGKNLGINKITKKGILFDLDGLQQANTEMKGLIGPWAESPYEIADLFSPEYRRAVFGTMPVATTKAMMWELGSTLNTITKEQIKEAEMHSGYKVDEIKGWNKIIKLCKKMTDEHPPNRPDFDLCINELTQIIEDYFKEEINK